MFGSVLSKFQMALPKNGTYIDFKMYCTFSKYMYVHILNLRLCKFLQCLFCMKNKLVIDSFFVLNSNLQLFCALQFVQGMLHVNVRYIVT